MKRIIITQLLLLISLSTFYGQEKNQFALGLQANQLEGNMGMGLQIVSPRFLEILTLTASGNYIWTDRINEDDRWNNYWNTRIGLACNLFHFNENSRLYIEGGMILIIPNRRITSDVGIGGYASLGAEATFFSRIGLFMEVGCAGYELNFKDFKIALTENYPLSNYSLLISAGVRFYIP